MRAAGRAGWCAHILPAGWLLLGLSGPVDSTAATADDASAFAAFLQGVYERTLQASPQLASELGSRVGDERWDDYAEPALAARAHAVEDDLATAQRRFGTVSLDAETALQYRVFVDEERLLLDRYRWRDHLYALNQIVGLHIDVPEVLTTEQRLDDARDADHYLRRIRAVRPAFAALIAHMRRQARHGVYMPRSIYPLLIEQARGVISGAPFDTGADCTILADFERRSATLPVTPRQRDELRAAVRTALRQDLLPAYRELIAFLQDQAAHSPVDGGVWQLPDGDEFYAFLVRQFTTTDMTPQQIHDLGLAEVARLHGEIDTLMQRVGFHGSLREFLAQVRADPRQYLADDDAGRAAYLARARGLVDAMQARLPGAFPAPLPPPLEIRRTESYKEASSPPGFYEPGTADGSRPGVVYLNLADMHAMPLYDLEDLLYHEGVPGHHLQISTIQRDAGIPALRKVNAWWQDTAFVEGWGLYAERLGKDLGGYQDPYAEFGLLAGELWRATRLVVDSGLHYKRWSRAQAIQYLDDNTPSPHETNERAVDRYLAVPGQATSFMVGMQRFVAERERARLALGSRFDLREYHRIALGSGYIPLWALHEKVSAWITAAGGDTPTVFDRMLEDYWRERLDFDPPFALSQGHLEYEGRFDESLDEAWRQRRIAMLDRYLAASATYSGAVLDATRSESLAILREQLTLEREYYGGPLFETARRLPIEQFQGRHLQFAADAAGSGDYPFHTVSDYDQELERAQAFAHWVDAAIARLREGAAAGVVLPRLIVERLLPQLQAHLGQPPERTEFWHPVAAMPAEFSAADRTRLTAAYRDSIAGVIQPAFQRLRDYLAVEYLPQSRASDGLGAVPGGAALYAHDVREHTTTTLTAAEIHALGIAEVERTLSRIDALQPRLGIRGSRREFLARVRNDRTQRFASRAAIIPAYEAARQRIAGRLPLLFDTLPRAPFEIRPLPDSAQQSPGNGYYSPAAADGSRPGVLWINTFAPGVQDRFNVMTISLHEGLPGHHLQTSLASENTALPAFRRADANDAYGEGWALYAESLGDEMGLYDDPWSAYGQLNYALLRANRLVVDTGLHALGWDVATGVRWMLDHSSMTRDQATAEVERYVAWPGQALAYKIGELSIRRLRQQAEQVQGARFDVRAFHRRILQGGSVPLTVLEADIASWLAAPQEGAS